MYQCVCLPTVACWSRKDDGGVTGDACYVTQHDKKMYDIDGRLGMGMGVSDKGPVQ